MEDKPSVQDYIDLMEAPTSAYDRVLLRHGRSPEVRNIPSYSERPKRGILDYVPTREELRMGTYDLMRDTGFSPRASEKTAQVLFGTRPDSLDESAMPLPDIGAADFLTGAALKRVVDPLLLTDAQTARLRGDAGESTLMAGFAAMPPAAYAYKEIKGLSGASDEVRKDVQETFDPSRRNFLKNTAGIAGLSVAPIPVIKMAQDAAPVAAKAAPAAVKAGKALKGVQYGSALGKALFGMRMFHNKIPDGGGLQMDGPKVFTRSSEAKPVPEGPYRFDPEEYPTSIGDTGYGLNGTKFSKDANEVMETLKTKVFDELGAEEGQQVHSMMVNGALGDARSDLINAKITLSQKGKTWEELSDSGEYEKLYDELRDKYDELELDIRKALEKEGTLLKEDVPLVGKDLQSKYPHLGRLNDLFTYNVWDLGEQGRVLEVSDDELFLEYIWVGRKADQIPVPEGWDSLSGAL